MKTTVQEEDGHQVERDDSGKAVMIDGRRVVAGPFDLPSEMLRPLEAEAAEARRESAAFTSVQIGEKWYATRYDDSQKS